MLLAAADAKTPVDFTAVAFTSSGKLATDVIIKGRLVLVNCDWRGGLLDGLLCACGKTNALAAASGLSGWIASCFCT